MLGEKVPFLPFVRTLVVSTKLELKPSQLWACLILINLFGMTTS